VWPTAITVADGTDNFRKTLVNTILELQGLIDGIDQGIIASLEERFRYSQKIGEIKKSEGKPPFDPERIATQSEQFVELGRSAGLNEDMSRKIISAIVEQVLTERLAKVI
jgi:chorismate mutase